MPAPAIYYGLNALSNNMIMADRKRLRTPNGVILGTPGSGKSFSAKREILSCFLITKDDIIICDPEGEYFALVAALVTACRKSQLPCYHGEHDIAQPEYSHFRIPAFIFSYAAANFLFSARYRRNGTSVTTRYARQKKSCVPVKYFFVISRCSSLSLLRFSLLSE